MSEQESLQKQLDKARQLLSVMEEQSSGFGVLHVPANLVIEISEKRKEIAELEKRLVPPTQPESATQLRVFLCHSSKDKPAVLELYNRLSKLPWIQPWLDKKDLIPGQNWSLQIRRAVRDSHIVLVCLSKSSVTHEGFVKKEIADALDVAETKPEDTIFLIPLRLEECEVPERISDWHWVDYFEEDSFDLLLKGLRLRAEQLGIEVTTISIPVPPTPKSEPQHAPEVIKQKDPQSAQPPVLPVVNYNAGIFPTPDPVPSAKPTPKPKSKPETEQEKLLRELDDPRTSHRRRLEIGDRLDEIGDTRPGVGLRADGLPDIAWLPVAPGGHISVENETFIVPPFYMAKYLITYAQYEAFVKDPQGYQNPKWWKGMPIGYHPQRLDEQVTKFKNSPRDTISWYQSVAFTRWLNQRLKGWQFPTPGTQLGQAWIIGQNAQVRLPTEWEWQWAAQGGSQQKAYPWGNWQEGYANTREAGLNRAVAVGMYPHGAATCGAMDLSGNLWEWCENKYSKHTGRRVLRGGSFSGLRGNASCVARSTDGYGPDLDYNDLGVRVVLVSALS